MAKKTKKKAHKKKKRKPNKKGPGSVWKHTSPAKIKAFRRKHSLNEAATARALGVSVGTLRNWVHKGKSAMESTQENVRDAMASYKAGGAARKAKKTKRKAERKTRKKAPSSNSDVAAEIALEACLEYMKRGGEVDAKNLLEKTDRVKRALTS